MGEKSVLIVDDEAIALSMLRQGLERDGFCVTAATNGQEALEVLRSGNHQLVISDWEMPGMDGIELCKEIRGGDFGRYIYFLMLTSHAREADIIQGLEAGADDFVTKPFSLPEIAVRLRAGQRLLSLGSAEMTIFLMAKLAESRDLATGAHLERVQSYAQVLAEWLYANERFKDQITPDFISLVYQTSPMHDIGKVAIPDHILLKPGVLTEQEFEIMKGHTLLGAQMLQDGIKRYPSAEYLQMAYEITLTHHEKYNGSGYPYGLSGDEIPLSGRIVAVADVFDALVSSRVYKEPVPVDEVHQMITDLSGIHFDPQVVEAYIATGERFRQIRIKYADGPTTVCKLAA